MKRLLTELVGGMDGLGSVVVKAVVMFAAAVIGPAEAAIGARRRWTPNLSESAVRRGSS